MTSVETMTTEEFVAECKRLRSEADAAENRMLDFLIVAESHPRLWNAGGKTFGEFIETHNLCRSIRYAAYKRAVGAVGREALEGASAEVVVAIGEKPRVVARPSAVREVLDRAKAFEAANGTTPSEQTARSFVRDAALVELGRAQRSKSKSYLDYARENESLRQQVAERDATIAALRAEIKAVKRELAEARRPAKRTKVAA